MINYEIVIWKKDDKFVGEIRELSLLCIGDKPENVARQLEDEKNQIFREYADLGILPPGNSKRAEGVGSGKWKSTLGLFTAKTSVAAFAISLVLMFTINHLSTQVLSVVGGATGPFHYLSVLATKFESLPEAAQDKAMHDLDIIVESLLPYAAKIKPLIDVANSVPPRTESKE